MNDYELWRVWLHGVQIITTLISPLVVYYLMRDKNCQCDLKNKKN